MSEKTQVDAEYGFLKEQGPRSTLSAELQQSDLCGADLSLPEGTWESEATTRADLTEKTPWDLLHFSPLSHRLEPARAVGSIQVILNRLYSVRTCTALSIFLILCLSFLIHMLFPEDSFEPHTLPKSIRRKYFNHHH